MKRTLTISAAFLVAALSLTGCSAGALSERSEPAAGPVDGTAEFESQGDTESAPREIIVTGSLVLTVDVPADAAADAVRMAESAGGRADARNEYAPVDGDKGSASLTLRLPSTTLTSTLDKIKKLGEVESLETSSDDVTTQSRDLDSRIDALEASIGRLHELLKTARSTDDLIELESAITERQSSLDSMKNERASLTDQVKFSTIDVSFLSVADAPAETPVTFVTGLETGWASFVAFVSGVLVLLGVLLPWLVFFAIIAVVVIVVIRRRVRRSAAGPSTTD
jgi:hypothetical protein